jgi:pilus assembly protein CpaB
MLLRNALLVLGALTLVAGAVLAVIWFRLPSSPAPSGPERAAQPAAILVAAANIPTGALLRASDMTWMIVEPSAIAPDDIVRGQASERDYLGAVTRRSFAAYEPLRARSLVRPSERNFLAAALSPGTQAVSLSVDASQSVSGLVQPGDRVDAVLLESAGSSSQGGTSDSASSVGVTVLHDARVVAVDQWFSPQTKPAALDQRVATAESLVPRTVTLELSAIDAKRLLVASQLGRITLVLRALAVSSAGYGASDELPQPVWGSEVSALQGGSRIARAAVPSVARSGSVLILRGAKTGAP